MIVLEEAHNLLLAKQAGAKESVLETSIRMVRQYGMGYVFVDQSASLLSKVAFANSYATLALSQKLRADVMTMTGAMNLTEEQRDALKTLPVGTAIVRLADQHPEPFCVKIPLCPVREGSVTDSMIRQRMQCYSAESRPNSTSEPTTNVIPPIPLGDRKIKEQMRIAEITHPPIPQSSAVAVGGTSAATADESTTTLSREEIRFLNDLSARPLSTTVSRYQRLNLSRRRGNAIRQSLAKAGIIEPVPIATRSGQVILYQLTDHGRSVCTETGIDPGPRSRESLEHRYWINQVAEHFERRGYDVSREYPVPNRGHVDLVAERPGERIAIEIETGKSDIEANQSKLKGAGFDQIIFMATSPAAVSACEKVLGDQVERMTWLDL
jgi:hypothetical protein